MRKFGQWLRRAWNTLLAGRTVKVRGRDVRLPELQRGVAATADEP